MFLGSPEKNSKASNQYDALFEKKKPCRNYNNQICNNLIFTFYFQQVLNNTFANHTFLMNGLIQGVKVSYIQC